MADLQARLSHAPWHRDALAGSPEPNAPSPFLSLRMVDICTVVIATTYPEQWTPTQRGDAGAMVQQIIREWRPEAGCPVVELSLYPKQLEIGTAIMRLRWQGVWDQPQNI